MVDTPQASPVPSCFLCPTLHHHHTEVNKIVQAAKNERPELPADWHDTPFCEEPTPHGPKQLTLSQVAKRYEKDHPNWDKGCESFPHSPLYFDKLENTTPYCRARDLEIKIIEARGKIQPIGSLNKNQKKKINAITDKILKSIKPMTEDLCLNDSKKIQQIRNATKNEVSGKLKDLRDPSKYADTLKDIQESAAEKIERASTAWTNYTGRIGEMGEFSTMKSVHRASKDKPSTVLQSYRLSKCLTKPLSKLGILINKDSDVEHDIVEICSNGDKLDVIFIQVKVLLKSKNHDSFITKIQEKVKKSLSQTRHDIEGFLLINPDLTVDDLHMIQFKTLSCLPATMNEDFLCDSCAQHVLFREDLNSDIEISQVDSPAELLHSDMVQQFKSGNNSSIKQKLGLHDVKTPTELSLNLLVQISARLVGLGSLYPIKTYGEYYDKLEQKMNRLETKTKHNLEQALFLGPEQSAALTSMCFAVSGFFGTGKTTVLEVACIRVAENKSKYPNPKIVFVSYDWNGGHGDSLAEGLKQRFKSKFKQLKQENAHLNDDNFEFLDGEEAMQKFEIQNNGYQANVQMINELIVNVKERYSDFSHHFLVLDEVPFNSNNAYEWTMSGDWTLLRLNDVHLTMALKPTADNKLFKPIGLAKDISLHLARFFTKTVLGGDPAISLQFPSEVKKLELTRQYRATQTIIPLFMTLLKHLNYSGFTADRINISATSPTPGHEILGDQPEILHLPSCNCYIHCDHPLEHVFKRYKSKILKLLRRVNAQMKEANITVLVWTHGVKEEEKCKDWLKQQIASEECLAGVQVVRQEQARGVEYPTLVTISDFGNVIGYNTTMSNVLEAWTRVTCQLYIVAADRSMYFDPLSRGLKDAVRKGEALNAVEQQGD